MTERYFVSYQGFSKDGDIVICGSVVVESPHKLETSKHMADLSDELSEELGQYVVIVSLFHMCTVKQEKGETKVPLNPDKWV